MAKLNYSAYFGKINDAKLDKSFVVEDPDDEELENTPQDVINILGFDPKEIGDL